MKRAFSSSLGALCFGAFLASATAQTVFTWSGIGTGWQGQVTPPNDGTAVFYLPKAINESIPLSGSTFNLHAILFATGTSSETYTIKAAAPLTLTIGTGVISTGTGYGRLVFDPNINITSATTLAFDAGNSTIVIPGQISGSTSLGLVSSNAANTGAFVFNNTGVAGNTYTGGTTISGVTGSSVITAFWNSSPFGSGTVDVLSSADFIAHKILTVANPFTFSTVTPNDGIGFKSWDAPLTLSGAITLGVNTTLLAQPSLHGVPSADNSGIYPTPGPGSRNPIIFTGGISGTPTLTVNGNGVLILNPLGTETYTGGTFVNGSLVFANNSAIPATGAITVNNSGYAGIANTAPGNFAAFLSRLSTASTGAVGVDTLPGGGTTVLTDNINLTGFTSSTISLGTATSAILTGTITPKGNNYQFGNGGGYLDVQSSLADISGPSSVQLTDANNVNQLVSPLKLYLQGTNTYTGGTVANNGFIIFDGASAIPGTGQLTAGGTAGLNGASYIGYTDAVTGMTPASFLTLFNKANTYGIIGFDTNIHSTSTAIISGNVDLTGFNNGVYLGTATSAILNGTLTPTADNTLRLTAANGGTLTVGSAITGATALSLGTPSTVEAYSNGTVVLNGTNTYTGGTTFNSVGTGLTAQVGNSGALGSGALTLPQDVSAGLQAGTSSITLPNAVSFQTAAVNHSPASLFITGTNPIALAGAITGPAGASINLTAPLTLSGNNSSFAGDINFVQATSLTLNNNNAAGTGTLYFDKTNSSLNFGVSALNPVLYGIESDNTGSINLNTGMVLTFDVSSLNNSTSFGGTIGNIAPINASLAVTASASGNALYLSGNNNYTGGTTVSNYGAVGLGDNNALGTGMVTLNASNGAVALNDGITFTNPLTFTAGALMGFGTFTPSNLTSTGITIGAGQAVIPGLYTISKQNLPGNLTFGTKAIFANGGQYFWSLQDVSRSDGSSGLFINGNLDLTTISTGGFTIDMLTFDATEHLGLANLVIGTPYTFTILTTTGTITGFNAANFAFNTSKFENGLATFPSLSLTADSSHLYLNFTAVPEPSTWALLATGAGMLGLAAFRRRRA